MIPHRKDEEVHVSPDRQCSLDANPICLVAKISATDASIVAPSLLAPSVEYLEDVVFKPVKVMNSEILQCLAEAVLRWATQTDPPLTTCIVPLVGEVLLADLEL